MGCVFQASGISVHPDVITAYQEIQTGHKHRFVVYKINDEKTDIVVAEKGARDAEYSDFLSLLSADECRFALYDFEYELPGGGGTREKLAFFTW